MNTSILKTMRIVGLTLLAGMLIYFFLMATLSPIRKYNHFKRIAMEDSVYQSIEGQFKYSSDLISLSREKAYKTALLDLSDDDSMALYINIPDSSVTLIINGVTLHYSKITRFKTDKFFKSLDNSTYIYIFRSPQRILSEYATIVKEPIVVKKAPKDTIEAALSVTVPDTLIKYPVFAALDLENQIRIQLIQDSTDNRYERRSKRRFKLKMFYEHFLNEIKDCINPSNSHYQPELKIYLPANDIRDIYRALPLNARLTIRLFS